MTRDLANLQSRVSNRLPEVPAAFCGIIGDRPSQSAKSPSLWNHLFQTFELPVTYLAFDVEARDLPDVVSALRESPAYLGGNVTMPYKVAIMPHLDAIDDAARAIGAVNTIVRGDDGGLTGYNTDGRGALDCVVRPQPGFADALLPDLAGRRVLLIGAGGAARAIAFTFAEALGPRGQLDIANRTAQPAADLAAAVNARSGNCKTVGGLSLAGYDLLINASTVGQFGMRRLADDRATCLEPYSSAAAAAPPVISSRDDDADFFREWLPAAAESIAANNAESLAAFASAPKDLRVFDAIFAPLETLYLRHARWSGHRGLNGKGMNIAQAADGFFSKVCAKLLAERGMARPEVYARIVETINSAW